MIELYFWNTPNGYKPLIMLEETGTAYEIRPIDISKGEQFGARFLQISPNNRIPAIIDRDPEDGGAPVRQFESGAILQYLAEKTGRFLPRDARSRAEVLQWLNWQMGGLGPMLGQHFHFSWYAPEKISYGIDRYRKEAERLLGVLDRRLEDRDWVADEYSVADMAIYPWIKKSIEEFPDFENIRRWSDTVARRPAVVRAYEAGGKMTSAPPALTGATTPLLLAGPRPQAAA